MKYEVIVAQDARDQFVQLDGRWRSRLKKEIRRHLADWPRHESKSRIKKLRGLRKPQYRLRVDEIRIFYDVNDETGRVEILGFIDKAEATAWLKTHGVPK